MIIRRGISRDRAALMAILDNPIALLLLLVIALIVVVVLATGGLAILFGAYFGGTLGVGIFLIFIALLLLGAGYLLGGKVWVPLGYYTFLGGIGVVLLTLVFNAAFRR